MKIEKIFFVNTIYYKRVNCKILLLNNGKAYNNAKAITISSCRAEKSQKFPQGVRKKLQEFLLQHEQLFQNS